MEGENLQDSDMEVLLEENMEIDDNFTRNIIAGVLSDGVSESTQEDADGSNAKMSNFRDSGVPGKEFPNGRRPDFELDDIMGEFEIDDSGNYIILRGANMNLLDKNGRPVNRRGYLIDKHSNVINRRGEMVFRQIELDSDDEIPAPLGFDKRKQNLLNMQNEDIEEMFDVITQKMVPVKKDELKSMFDTKTSMFDEKRSTL